MTQEQISVCVFCGSSFGKDPKYEENARKLGETIGSKNWGLVYGGGSTGLMGAVANGCSSSGGDVVGIIPKALISRERKDEIDTSNDESDSLNAKLKESINNHDGSTPIPDSTKYGKTILVNDMHTRKKLMGQKTNRTFIALPGGFGTLEEILEIITWKQLSIHNKQVILFNIDGFYDNFLKFINDCVSNQFISPQNGKIIEVATTVEEVIELVENYTPTKGTFNLNWDTT
ncbi:uncharacterized protein KGF55_005273 [Candida pseudojiufengensis]|uniref:uncharacterized protein n=1 Tax=Candida pseudojiufengensis TaxID=497109 RepID=UPI002224354D|nr:uncharacterized protein KGF55_005273 [Candida pseudojiufengensis]KAI5959629.1 hypothetical protein KGF55_005273 [Candida pseudojiufengensis]